MQKVTTLLRIAICIFHLHFDLPVGAAPPGENGFASTALRPAPRRQEHVDILKERAQPRRRWHLFVNVTCTSSTRSEDDVPVLNSCIAPAHLLVRTFCTTWGNHFTVRHIYVLRPVLFLHTKKGNNSRYCVFCKLFYRWTWVSDIISHTSQRWARSKFESVWVSENQ